MKEVDILLNQINTNNIQLVFPFKSVTEAMGATF